MSWIALPLLLIAVAPPPKSMVAQTHAVASVQIVSGEEIRFEELRETDPKRTHRQKRVRDGVPMVEFY